MESAAKMQDHMQAQNERVVFTFDIPEKFRNEAARETVGMVKLTGAEEELASRKARNDTTRLAYELVRTSIFKIDGRVINRGNAEGDKLWNRIDPKLRQLLLAAYADLHTPEDDETEDFLESRKEEVG